MKKTYLAIIAVLLSLSMRAQDTTAASQGYNCDDLSYSYADAIVRYYSAYNDDSVRWAAEEWERACGISEPLLSFNVLYAIEKGTFTEDLYHNNIAGWLMLYRQHAEGDLTKGNLPNVPDDYYVYLRSVAKSLQPLQHTPLEKTLVDFYATGDEDVLDNMDTSLTGTRLYKSFTAYKNEQYKLFGRFHASVFLGAWVPQGNIGVLGSHPLIGFQLGSLWQRFSLDAHFSFRFLPAPRHYTVYHLGGLKTTRYYSAFYAGLDAGYYFVESGKHRVGLLGGLGYDAITVVKSTDDEQYNGKFLSSFNLNGGLGYKYYFKKKNYIGLMGKYNLLYYKNKSGTDLSGNAVTVALVYGFH